MSYAMTGSILAGGKSRRMGFDKAFIKVGGRSVIERSVGLFREVFEDVNIIANDVLIYEGLGVRVISDLIKGAGSLGGVYTAVFHSASDFTFVAACDMPCLDKETIKKMIDSLKGRSSSYGAVVPFIDGKFHPMHALYSKKCLKQIETMIKDGNLRITDLFEKVRTKRLDEGFFNGLPIAASVENVNTNEDLLRITTAEK